MTDANDDFWGEPIYSYSRAQAIEDGVLVDVSAVAREAGFKVPVALTYAVYNSCVEWTEEDSRKQVHQDPSGRLWDVLVTAIAAGRAHDEKSQMLYKLACVPRDGWTTSPTMVDLKLIVGPGDTPEPVVTILLPGED